MYDLFYSRLSSSAPLVRRRYPQSFYPAGAWHQVEWEYTADER